MDVESRLSEFHIRPKQLGDVQFYDLLSQILAQKDEWARDVVTVHTASGPMQGQILQVTRNVLVLRQSLERRSVSRNNRWVHSVHYIFVSAIQGISIEVLDDDN